MTIGIHFTMVEPVYKLNKFKMYVLKASTSGLEHEKYIKEKRTGLEVANFFGRIPHKTY